MVQERDSAPLPRNSEWPPPVLKQSGGKRPLLEHSDLAACAAFEEGEQATRSHQERPCSGLGNGNSVLDEGIAHAASTF